jgi:hypothetical protein
MLFVIAVGEIDAGGVHPCLSHFDNGLFMLAGRAQSTDNAGIVFCFF